MTKLLVKFTRKIVYLLWLQNSGYIYFGIIIPVNVTGKYSKSSVISVKLYIVKGRWTTTCDVTDGCH